eukprot:TRINITY_DN2159_c0_g2_i2.p1 TRINITY_DN2159_c0_g2~~TRINITY_DN2159_c0_g2_i2.p1  ORF type:complete len:154 (+),score=12.51 TRINITY_DN2159_c0_g2_i2:73-534(+)
MNNGEEEEKADSKIQTFFAKFVFRNRQFWICTQLDRASQKFTFIKLDLDGSLFLLKKSVEDLKPNGIELTKQMYVQHLCGALAKQHTSSHNHESVFDYIYQVVSPGKHQVSRNHPHSHNNKKQRRRNGRRRNRSIEVQKYRSIGEDTQFTVLN